MKNKKVCSFLCGRFTKCGLVKKGRKAPLKETSQSGHTLMELLVILVLMTLLALGGIRAFRGALDEHEADRVYEEILVTATGVLNRGTARTRAGFADSMLVTSATRMGKGFALKEGCPMNAFTIKVDGVDQDTCTYLMQKTWPKGITPLAFYRSDRFDRLCEAAGSLSDGYYLDSETDCTKAGAPDKGAFAVVFRKITGWSGFVNGTTGVSGWNTADAGTSEPPATCETNADCNAGNACLTCNTHTHLCENGCTQMAYLRTTGNRECYINTDYVPVDSTRLVARMMGEASVSSGLNFYGGGGTAHTNELSCYLWNNIIQFHRYGEETTTFYAGNWFNHENSKTVRKITYDNGFTKTFSKNINATYNQNKLVLFSANRGNPSGSATPVRIAYFQIYDNTGLVRDFIPVHTSFDTDGKHNCMFDRVSKGLFCNALSVDCVGPAE